MPEQRRIHPIEPFQPEGYEHEHLDEQLLVEMLIERFLHAESSAELKEGINEFAEAFAKKYRARQQQGDPGTFVLFGLDDSLLRRLPIEAADCRISAGNEPSTIIVEHVDIKGDKTSAEVERATFLNALRYVGKKTQEAIERVQEGGGYVAERATSSRHVTMLHGGRVLKRPLAYNQDERNRALKRLHDLPERSPYLAYPDTTRDMGMHMAPDNTPRHFSLDQKMDFVTLEQLMRRDAVSLHDAIGIVRDAVRGLVFLDDHGLRLSDLDRSNIGVHPYTRRGFLYDYDGLLQTPDEAIYYAKESHYPPADPALKNTKQPSKPRVRITEKDMMHELSVTLAQVAQHFSERGAAGTDLMALEMLAAEMHGDHPRRPSIKDCLRALDALVPLESTEEVNEAAAKPYPRPSPSSYIPPVGFGTTKRRTTSSSRPRRSAQL